jgi:CIC family chloride channel protein
VLGGVLHAPLTAIFLIAEMTNGYELIVPLMLVTAISFVTIKTFDPHSIFTKALAKRGELISHHKDKTVLTLMKVTKVIDEDVITIKRESTLKELTKVIARSKRNIFPVVDDNNNFEGLVILDDVREDMFKRNKYNDPIEKYIFHPKDTEVVSTSDSMEKVMDKFNKSGNYNLVVLENGKYIGLVSRANIFNAYRRILLDVSQDD